MFWKSLLKQGVLPLLLVIGITDYWPTAKAQQQERLKK
jgi:hypothetical protein